MQIALKVPLLHLPNNAFHDSVGQQFLINGGLNKLFLPSSQSELFFTSITAHDET